MSKINLDGNLPCALNFGMDINEFEAVTYEELLVINNNLYGHIKDKN